MELLKLQSHFVLPVILSILFLGILILLRKKIYKEGKWRVFWISLTVFFIGYLFILLRFTYLENCCDLLLQSFDLNNDGNFSFDERTPEQKIAMQKVTSDTARTFAPITGIFIAGLVASTVLFVGKITEYVRRNKKL